MNKITRPLFISAVVLCSASLVACKDDVTNPAEVPKASTKVERTVVVERERPAPVASCFDCGTVSNIEEISIKGKGSGIGAVTGAVIGGVAGHQVGGGRGKDVATVAGAAGGAYAGHEAEKRYNATKEYRVTVALENGGSRTVNMGSLNGVSVGSRVKVVGNGLQLI